MAEAWASVQQLLAHTINCHNVAQKVMESSYEGKGTCCRSPYCKVNLIADSELDYYPFYFRLRTSISEGTSFLTFPKHVPSLYSQSLLHTRFSQVREHNTHVCSSIGQSIFFVDLRVAIPLDCPVRIRPDQGLSNLFV